MAQKYIVRGDRSGVFYGEITRREGREVEMANARCLWYWSGAFTLLELSQTGVSAPNACKFTHFVKSIVILDAIEVLPCTEDAEKSVDGVAPWEI